MKRNLIYFIYFNGELSHYHKLNLDLLRQYKDVFTGQVIVKLAVNDLGQDISQIKDRIPFDFEIVKNNRLHEAGHFIESLSRISSGETFYGHCKGVTRGYTYGLDQWIINLYKLNLENHEPLNGKLFSGVCVKNLPCPPYVPEPFHYSGSFYWFDMDKVKKRMKPFNPNVYFTERFPAIIAKPDECIFGKYTYDKNINFYGDITWKRIHKGMVF